MAEDLERSPGAWSSVTGLLKIDRSGDQLKVELDGDRFNLVRREDGYYHLQYKLLGLFPVDLQGLEKPGFAYQQIAGREVIVAYIDGRPFSIVAEKAKPQPLPPAWEQHLGRYEITNARGGVLLQSIELSYKEGLLQVKSRVKTIPGVEEITTMVLVAVNDNEAVIHGLGRGKGDTVRFFERDGESLASYSGFLLRRVE